MKRVEVLGVPVDCITETEAVNCAESAMLGQRPCSILAVNPEKVLRAQREPALLEALRSAGLLIPDGIGVVLAAHLLHLGHMSRVPGSELMPAICEQASKEERAIFLFGASPEVNEEVGRILPERYPGLRIAGRQHGYVKEDDMPVVIEAINSSRADILFVALGSPKQEYWVHRYLPHLKVKVCQGVGGTFDVIAGRVKRAPLLFRLMHLEWFYRLLSQPSRIVRQTALPLFVYQVLKCKVTRKPDLEPALSAPPVSVSRGNSDPGRSSDPHREKAA
jgi:N-acetylglucosaminyldiphosphoundecaprenol N-acetyl-beta-D-mannosaminyltransferase